MRFLVDQPVSPLLAQWLCSTGHDAFHVRERGLSPATDEELFSLAVAERRTIITADLDFARIIALSGRDGSGLILFRAGSVTDDRMLALLREALERVPPKELERSVVVVDGHALRVAPPPLRPDLAE